MRRRACVLALAFSACRAPLAPPVPPTDFSAAADRIAAASERTSAVGWDRLSELTDDVGQRITGSAALDQALAWAARRMHDDGLDGVRLEPVQVPHWVRGVEHARIVRPVDRPLALLGLGGTVGTHGTLRAPLVA